MFSGFLLKAGLGGAVMLAAFAWHQWDRDAAYADGQRAERVVWQELQARATARAEEKRQADQDRINAAERTYLGQSQEFAIQQADLRKGLDHAQDAVRKCTAVTRQLRDKLAVVGTHP